MFKGKTFSKIDVGDDTITFYENDKPAFVMYHAQDCCESVYVEDVIGDINDLINTEILEYREDSDHGKVKDDEFWSDSFTWTFYNFRTIKGSVTIRWYGTSNGCYSESVDVKEIKR